MALKIEISGATFTDTALPVLYPDAVMTPGTVFAFDFSNPVVWPAQADAVLDDTFANLVSGGGSAIASRDLTFFGGGFDFSVFPAGQSIQLPAEAGLTANTGGFVATVWMKHEVQVQAFAGHVFGYRNATEGTWGLRYENPKYYAIINGEEVQVSRALFEDGLPHQVSLAWVRLPDNSYEKRVYVDGVVIHSSASAYTSIQTIAGPPDYPALGDGSNTGLNGWWEGHLYRAWADDLGVSGKDVGDLLAVDLAENTGRFG